MAATVADDRSKRSRNLNWDFWCKWVWKLIETFSSISVQLCRPNPGTARHDGETAGAGNGLQDHGARQRIDEG